MVIWDVATELTLARLPVVITRYDGVVDTRCVGG